MNLYRFGLSVAVVATMLTATSHSEATDKIRGRYQSSTASNYRFAAAPKNPVNQATPGHPVNCRCQTCQQNCRHAASCPCPICQKRVHLTDAWHGFQTAPLFRWLIDDGYYTRSPDHGYLRVRKVPIERKPIVYYRYWPTKWYGQPGSGKMSRHFPTIASPTDTMQLGYYYQTVPMWQPNPSKIPRGPNPLHFHFREKCPPMPARPCPHNIVWINKNTGEVPAPAPADQPIDPPPAPSADQKAPEKPKPNADDLKKSASRAR